MMAGVRRLLLVHAHPDDESISTGGVMARYAAEGAQVTLVTCTRGEEGEIVPLGLRHLGTGKPLADVRTEELAGALAELGVTDHRWLGPYEDSGMMGTPANDKATAFWNADLDEAAARLAAILTETRPQVVVTYDEHGGYGHPDHIQAHRVTLLACDRAPYLPRLYYLAKPDRATAVVDVSAYAGRKLAAMAAHRTQLTVDGRTFALSDGVVHEVRDEECFALAHGTDRETDLFAGVTDD